MLAFIALAAVGAWLPAVACAAAVPDRTLGAARRGVDVTAARELDFRRSGSGERQ